MDVGGAVRMLECLGRPQRALEVHERQRVEPAEADRAAELRHGSA